MFMWGEKMRVAVGQMEVIPGDVEKNLKNGLDLISKAKKNGCDLILLPEVWTTGFLFKRLKELAKFTEETINEVKKASKDILICGTFVVDNEQDNKKVFNKFYAIHNQKTVFEYTKTMLFGVTGEDSYFSRGDIKQNNVFEFNEVKIGASVCYELRFPEFFRRASFNSALIHLHPAIWPVSRLEHWNTLTKARSIENQLYFICANGTGKSGKWELAGNSKIYSPWGEVVEDMEKATGIKFTDINFKEIEEARKNLPSLKDSLRFFK